MEPAASQEQLQSDGPGAAAEKRRVTVGEKSFDLAPEIADIFEMGSQEMQALRKELSLTKSQAQAAEERWSRLERVIAPPQELHDPDVDFFKNPQKHLQALRDSIVNEVRQQNQTKSFWDDFYAKHDDLRGMESYVRFILAENPQFLDQKTSVASENLAKAVRESALGIVRKGRQAQRSDIAGAFTEGGRSGRGASLDSEESDAGEKSFSMAENLRKRMEKRLLRKK